MACYKPLIRFYVPNDREASGRVYTLRRFSKLAKKPNITYEELVYRKDVMLIPCGQCIGCKIQKREDWACRIEMEAKQWPKDSIWFVTLTYDDKNVPYLNHDTGVIDRGGTYTSRNGALKTNQTLWYEDVQKFLKRLRKTYKSQLRYFVAGEYGETTGRPHYHMILFNYHPEELKPYRLLSKPGYFVDSRIEKCWGLGIHNLSQPMDAKAYSYTAGYVTKKMPDEKMNYLKNGLMQPFCQMSRDPGLGYEYYQQHKEQIWEQGYIQLGNGKRASIPRYFQEMYKAENPEALWEFKRQRQQKAIDSTRDRMSKTDVPIKEYLANKEAVIKHKAIRSKGL